MEHDNVQPWEEQAQKAYELGNLDGALAAYQEILNLDPDHPGALNRMGAIRAQRGEFDAAEATLRQAIAVAPDLASARSNLGNILLARGDATAALACYKEAVNLEPDSPVFHENMAAAYKRLKDITNMVAELKKAQKLQTTALKREAGSEVGRLTKRAGCLPVLAFLALTGTAAIILLG